MHRTHILGHINIFNVLCSHCHYSIKYNSSNTIVACLSSSVNVIAIGFTKNVSMWVCIQSNTVFPVHVSNVENVLAFQMQTVMKENRMKKERVSERENWSEWYRAENETRQAQNIGWCVLQISKYKKQCVFVFVPAQWKANIFRSIGIICEQTHVLQCAQRDQSRFGTLNIQAIICNDRCRVTFQFRIVDYDLLLLHHHRHRQSASCWRKTMINKPPVWTTKLMKWTVFQVPNAIRAHDDMYRTNEPAIQK